MDSITHKERAEKLAKELSSTSPLESYARLKLEIAFHEVAVEAKAESDRDWRAWHREAVQSAIAACTGRAIQQLEPPGEEQ